VRVELSLTGSYLDYAEAEGLCVPPVPLETGVVLSGKLPLWLWTAIALAYHDARWLAVYQPQLGDQAVVIRTQTDQKVIGRRVHSAATSTKNKDVGQVSRHDGHDNHASSGVIEGRAAHALNAECQPL
jgi:CRISPR-associated protein Csx3